MQRPVLAPEARRARHTRRDAWPWAATPSAAPYASCARLDIAPTDTLRVVLFAIGTGDPGGIVYTGSALRSAAVGGSQWHAEPLSRCLWAASVTSTATIRPSAAGCAQVRCLSPAALLTRRRRCVPDRAALGGARDVRAKLT